MRTILFLVFIEVWYAWDTKKVYGTNEREKNDGREGKEKEIRNENKKWKVKIT